MGGGTLRALSNEQRRHLNTTESTSNNMPVDLVSVNTLKYCIRMHCQHRTCTCDKDDISEGKKDSDDCLKVAREKRSLWEREREKKARKVIWSTSISNKHRSVSFYHAIFRLIQDKMLCFFLYNFIIKNKNKNKNKNNIKNKNIKIIEWTSSIIIYELLI